MEFFEHPNPAASFYIYEATDMTDITLSQVYTFLIAASAFIISISGAAAVIGKLVKWMRKPETTQDEKIEEHEKRLNEHDERMAKFDKYFENDDKRLKYLEEGNRVTQKSLLAIMGYLMNNNDPDKLQRAFDDLEQHLVDK